MSSGNQDSLTIDNIFLTFFELLIPNAERKGQNMRIPHLKKQGNATVLFVEDKPFIALAGEVHNSDSSSPEYMEKNWKIRNS